MQTKAFLGALAAVLALGIAPAASEPPGARPAAHEELTRHLDSVLDQLHGLAARWRGHFHHGGPRGGRPLITLMLRQSDELELSHEQIMGLKELRADFRREAIRRRADLRIAEMDLMALLDADTVDLAKVEAKVRGIGEQRAELRLLRIRAIEDGKALLTSEQRSKLRTLLSQHRQPRQRSGGSGGHSGRRL